MVNTMCEKATQQWMDQKERFSNITFHRTDAASLLAITINGMCTCKGARASVLTILYGSTNLRYTVK